MKFAVCLLLALIATIECKPQFPQASGQFDDGQYRDRQLYGPPEPYEFNYKVDNAPTNTYFGHSENGDIAGNKVGSFYVLLPDGRTMTVSYVADGNGYVPKISFQGGGQPGQPARFQG